MNRSYWDVSSILADAVRLPCHVTRDCPGLAHLQGNVESTGGLQPTSSAAGGKSAEKDGLLRKNTRIDVPFWLAELLALHGIVDLSVPRPYAARVRNALDAEAKSVQLRNLNAWWYAIGIRLGSLMEASELLVVLQSTYSARLAQIFSSGQHMAASSNLRSTGKDLDDITAHVSDNVDSLGGYSAISMSGEMVEFINGLEESEVQREWECIACSERCFANIAGRWQSCTMHNAPFPPCKPTLAMDNERRVVDVRKAVVPLNVL